MKKIYTLSIFVAVLALASSCVQEEKGTGTPQPRRITLTAGADDTKTVLEDGAVKWEDGDEIALVFGKEDASAVCVTTLSTEISEGTAASAAFTGTLPSDVSVSSGYSDAGCAVYPASAVATDGSVSFDLPYEQSAGPEGSFPSGYNLSSAAVSLQDILADGSDETAFHNGLAYLRFVLSSDVASVRLTGTAPMAGKAPVTVSEDGFISVDGIWDDEDMHTSVTLVPADGAETFADNTEYNLLIWPGTHSSLTLKVVLKDVGEYEKTVQASVTFERSKYYTLSFNVDADELVTALDEKAGSIVTELGAIRNRIEDAEEKADEISGILSQIQSVVLMSEYLDNAVYAPYAVFTSANAKKDIVLDYLVRPASVASALAEKCTEAMSSVVSSRTASGLEFTSLPVKAAVTNSDVMTVTVDASDMPDAFYDGTRDAELALHISDGITDILSDFARLVPKQGPGVRTGHQTDVPVIAGARVSIPFSYSVAADSDVTFSAAGNKFTGNVSCQYNEDFKTGYLLVDISDAHPVSDQMASLTISSGGEECTYDFTFVEGGTFEVTSNGAVDYIGGEVSVSVTSSSFSSYASALTSGGSWIQQSGVGTTYTLEENTENTERTANLQFTITNGDLKYHVDFPIRQYAYGTPLTRTYYSDGQYIMLNEATASGIQKPLNLVILGDGYRKKDLAVGGKFERSAKSAMGSFFGIEPFTSFMDRFNVYMLAFESADEGTDITSESVSKDTYFHSVWAGGGNTQLTCDWESVKTAVEEMGLSASSYDLYRTVAILLVNTDANAGSCNYLDKGTASISDVGDGFREFSIAALAANNTSFGGLVKHEAGGHGFGRLGDEYNTGNADRTETALAENHALGFYLNISFKTDSGCPWYDLVGYDGIGCFEGAWGSATGIYRPSETSIMLNNQGKFNAQSRRVIYRRIIRQTEGYNAYSDAAFKEYDIVNL